jgi:TatD DNase family protein
MHNIHTHLVDNKNRSFQLLNRLLADAIPKNCAQPFSIGLHPWHIQQHLNWQEELPKKIEELIDLPSFMAIGECGLDKNTAISLDLQTSVLNLHYELALRFSKPIIIHCVGAFNELLSWKKGLKNTVPMLVHGFEKKMELLNDLLKAGFYVSFGAALCKDRPTLHHAFLEMPLDRLFLETDDQSDYSIEAVYRAAASIKKISVDAIDDQIMENFNLFF